MRSSAAAARMSSYAPPFLHADEIAWPVNLIELTVPLKSYS
jgi:hypothetical protein